MSRIDCSARMAVGCITGYRLDNRTYPNLRKLCFDDSGTARVGIFSFQTCPIREIQLAGGFSVAEKEGWAETRAIVTMKDYIPA